MNIKYMTLTCAILITAYTTLGFGFQNVNSEKTASAPTHVRANTFKPEAKPQTASKATPKMALVNSTDADQDRITQLVYIIRQREGRAYAERVASAITTSARRNKIPVMLVATTAYIESEFRMVSRPCVGIMQILPSTARRVFGRSGLDVYDLEDNIEMGSRYLAMHYHEYARPYINANSANDKLTSAEQMLVMRKTWGRYNGSGMNGAYQRKATTVYKRLTEWNSEKWKSHINTKGPLWKG